jgi:lysophospholipase L1-like esterase
MSGSCHIESATADYLAGLSFDFATLELGINMRSAFDPPEFEGRVVYLLNKLREGHPETPLVLITHFLNKDHHLAAEPHAEARKQIAFDDILRRQHAERADANLHLLEGTELLTDFGLLAADLIHPTHEGHAQMGLRLAERLRGMIE